MNAPGRSVRLHTDGLECGVKQVEILAMPDQEVRISLDIEKMAQMNISIEQVRLADGRPVLLGTEDFKMRGK